MIRGYTLVFRLLTGFRVSDVTNGFRAYRLALLDDPRIRIGRDWLDHYELEYYLHWKAITLGYRVVEVGVSKTYPKRRRLLQDPARARLVEHRAPDPAALAPLAELSG